MMLGPERQRKWTVPRGEVCTREPRCAQWMSGRWWCRWNTFAGGRDSPGPGPGIVPGGIGGLAAVVGGHKVQQRLRVVI